MLSEFDKQVRYNDRYGEGSSHILNILIDKTIGKCYDKDLFKGELKLKRVVCKCD